MSLLIRRSSVIWRGTNRIRLMYQNSKIREWAAVIHFEGNRSVQGWFLVDPTVIWIPCIGQSNTTKQTVHENHAVGEDRWWQTLQSFFVSSIFNSLHFIPVFEDGPDAFILRLNSFEYCSHDWIRECRNKWVSSTKKKFKCQCTSIEPNINSHCIRFVCNLHQYCVLRSTEPRTRLKGMHTFCLFTR